MNRLLDRAKRVLLTSILFEMLEHSFYVNISALNLAFSELVCAGNNFDFIESSGQTVGCGYQSQNNLYLLPIT